MKNIARCKLCHDIIESMHSTDYVACACGQIGVDGGTAMKCSAIDWTNFLRIDEDGNEVTIKIQDIPIINTKKSKLTKKEIITILNETIETIEKLPAHALSMPLSHYDYLSLLFLLKSLFASEDD